MLALVVCGLAAAAPAPAAGATGNLPPPIPRGRALAALAEHPSVLLAVEPGTAAERLVAGQGGTLVSRDLGIWKVGGGASERLVPELDRLGLLRYAEPSRSRFLAGHLDEGDPLLDKAWFIDRVGAAGIEPPGPGVSVTIIDTGLDTGHPDFAGRPNVALLNQQSPVSFDDEFYHGTIVASTVGAAANGVGSVGVYPTSALRIFKLRSLTDPDIIAALDSAATGDVVNLSIGGPGYSRSLYEAIMRAVDRGALVVAAGGNHFGVGNPDIYPADYPHVITVAATDQANQPLFFSSANPAVDLAAPGAGIPIQDPTDPENFAVVDGTSFAAPIVSGVAAWVWTERPELDRSQIFALLRESATDIGRRGFDTRTGTGLVNLPAALAAKAPIPDPERAERRRRPHHREGARERRPGAHVGGARQRHRPCPSRRDRGSARRLPRPRPGREDDPDHGHARQPGRRVPLEAEDPVRAGEEEQPPRSEHEARQPHGDDRVPQHDPSSNHSVRRAADPGWRRGRLGGVHTARADAIKEAVPEDLVSPAAEEYALEHTTTPVPELAELRAETEEKMPVPQMAGGVIEARLLEGLVVATGARRVLEIGTFTGYSALSMAAALPEGGTVTTLERDEHAAAIARRYVEASPHGGKIEILMGDALELIASLSGPFNLVFIDASKREYTHYYEAVLPKLADRGLIVADNMLWGGDALDPDTTDTDTVGIRAFADHIQADPRVSQRPAHGRRRPHAYLEASRVRL